MLPHDDASCDAHMRNVCDIAPRQVGSCRTNVRPQERGGVQRGSDRITNADPSLSIRPKVARTSICDLSLLTLLRDPSEHVHSHMWRSEILHSLAVNFPADHFGSSEKINGTGWVTLLRSRSQAQ